VKKVIVTILAFLYLGMSSGIAMEIHYCMGKKAGVDFFGNDNDRCGKCGMKEKKNGCCNDEHKFYKLSDSHKNVSNTLSFEAPVVSIPEPLPTFDFLLIPIPVKSNIANHSPPAYDRPPVCILHCVFRI